MAAKSSNLNARIEPELKEKAENILSALGISASSAINMFYKQIVLHGGLPFEVKLPPEHSRNFYDLSESELNELIQKGLDDIEAGRTTSAEKVFSDIRKDYGL